MIIIIVLHKTRLYDGSLPLKISVTYIIQERGCFCLVYVDAIKYNYLLDVNYFIIKSFRLIINLVLYQCTQTLQRTREAAKIHKSYLTQSLFKVFFTNNAEKANTIICKPVFRYHSRFFNNLRPLFSQENDLSTTHLVGITLKTSISLRFATSTIHPQISDTELANFSPVGSTPASTRIFCTWDTLSLYF